MMQQLWEELSPTTSPVFPLNLSTPGLTSLVFVFVPVIALTGTRSVTRPGSWEFVGDAGDECSDDWRVWALCFFNSARVPKW